MSSVTLTEARERVQNNPLLSYRSTPLNKLPKLRSSQLSRQGIPVVEAVMTLKMLHLSLSSSLHSQVYLILACVHVVFTKERFHFVFI
jgi:hypothetical protein